MDVRAGTAKLVREMRDQFPATDHYKNGRFFNPGVKEHGPGDLLRWVTNRERGAWRKRIPSTPGPKPVERVEGPELRVTFVGHATVLLQSEGLNLLTDPVWSQRVSPVSWAGPKRHRQPGLRLEDLPPIDALLLSHSHYDHFDLPTLKKIRKRHSPVVFCPLGMARMVRRLGFEDIHELDWGEATQWRHLTLHCTRAQHFSARTPFDRNRTLWCGWVAGFAGGDVYFAGDTGYGEWFRELGEAFPALRLALLPIGAYRPEWFMGPIHMTPWEAARVHGILRPRASVGIHYGSFSLADDGETEPVDGLRSAHEEVAPETPFLLLPEGEARRF